LGFLMKERKSDSLPQGSSMPELDDLYNILGNPHRRRIILFLGEVGEAGFTELRRHLGMSVGTLYYNLDNLRGLVIQKPNKKYALSERGRRVYEIISKEIKRIEEMYREPHCLVRIYNKYIGRFVTPVDAFSRMYRNAPLTTALGLVTLVVGALGLILSGLDITLLDFEPCPSGALGMPRPLWLIAKLLASWLAITAISVALAKLFGARLERIELVSATMIAMAPVLAYPYVYYLLTSQNLLTGALVLLSNLLLRLLQMVTVGFLTASISVFGGISLERAFFIAFIIIYLSFTLSFLI